MRIVDLSHPLDPNTPPFPGDPPVEFTIHDSTDQTDRSPREHVNLSGISTSVHCGTHMDAPFHFFGNRATIDVVPLDVCVGPAALIDLSPLPPESEITADHLRPFAVDIRETGRVLLNSGWHHEWGREGYFTRHPVIAADAAELLVRSACRLVGVDFPSVDRPPYSAHLELLGNDVIILENLTNLAAIGRDRFQLIATPLALTGRDGSPVRVVARLDEREGA